MAGILILLFNYYMTANYILHNLKSYKWLKIYGFCEFVYYYLFFQYVSNIYFFKPNLFVNLIILHFDKFCTLKEFRIFGKLNSFLIIRF